MSFTHMKTMINAVGGTIRGTKIHDGQVLMTNQLMTDPSYRDSYRDWEFGKDVLKTLAIKLYDEKTSNVEGVTVKFNCLIDDKPLIGEVLYNTVKNEYWLVTQSYDRDNILADGTLRKVNYWLKWQNSDGDILEYPACDMNTTQYNSGEAGNEQIQIGSAQHVFYMPADENTILIDHGLRAFIDRNTVKPTVYRVTQNDTTTLSFEKGIVKVTFSEDEFKLGVDRIDLWLCDYKEPKPQQDIEITYIGSPTVRVGMSKTFTASYNAVAWETICGDDVRSCITLTDKGDGVCDITATIKQRIIGKSFILRATADNGNVGEITVTVTGGV